MPISTGILNIHYYLCCLDCRMKRKLVDTPNITKWLGKHIGHRLYFIPESVFTSEGKLRNKQTFNELDKKYSFMSLDIDIIRKAIIAWRNGDKESTAINKYVIHMMEVLDKYID